PGPVSLSPSAVEAAASPASDPGDPPLSEERIVAVWEALRGSAYSSRERPLQLKAARRLLALQLPAQLTAELLVQVYRAYFDEWWQQKYGLLQLSHLVETEKSSGQIRLVRWLKRLLQEEETQEAGQTRHPGQQRPGRAPEEPAAAGGGKGRQPEEP